MKDANLLENGSILETDVLIIGSGAGGANAAKILSKNRKVLIIEEGPYQTNANFSGEFNAYKNLYMEGSARYTKDKAIRVLQGRAVGGSALVNWTTSFRTPTSTLNYWKSNFGIDFVDKLNFENEEKEYSISKWSMEPNLNNEKLKLACESMGWEWNIIKRNVQGCANLGLCGTGCPINAKRSPLVTSIPTAIENGAKLVFNLRAWKLNHKKGEIESLECVSRDGKNKILIKAKTYILAAGAVGSPALLLRSKVKDPYNKIGARTFLHPTVLSSAFYDEKIEGARGAPQSVYSDHFLNKSFNDSIGFKLEAAPVYPILYSSAFSAHGEEHAAMMKQRAYASGHVALMRDGFHSDSQGGQVELDKYGNPVLDYKISPYLWKGMKSAMINLSKAQLKSGAKRVYPGITNAQFFTSSSEVESFIRNAPEEPVKFPVFSAHVMGGCTMGSDKKKSVLDLDGKLRTASNVFVVDASIFPTSVGANPTESIFAFSTYLAKKLV